MTDENNVAAVPDSQADQVIGEIHFRIEHYFMPDFRTWQCLIKLLSGRTSFGRNSGKAISRRKVILWGRGLIIGLAIILPVAWMFSSSILFLDFHGDDGLVVRGTSLSALVTSILLFCFFLGRLSRSLPAYWNTRRLRRVSYNKKQEQMMQYPCSFIFGDTGMMSQDRLSASIIKWPAIQEIRLEGETCFIFDRFFGFVFTRKNFSSVDEYHAWLDFIRSKQGSLKSGMQQLLDQ